MAKLDLNVNVETKGTGKLDNLGSKLGGIGKSVALGVVGLAGAGVAAGLVFGDMAAEAEKAQAKLESVFKSTGAAAFTSVEALNAHAEALAKSTTFDDDAVKAAQASLLAFGNITGDVFTGATEGAADLAAFMGTDIATAASSLGKVLSDPEAGLGRLQKIIGPLNEEQEKLIQNMIDTGDVAGAQAAILDIVGGKIGTVAEDLAGTSSGQMTQAMNALGEAGESLGVILLPIFTLVAQGIKGFADFVVANMPIIQSVITTVFGAISKIFAGASGSVGGLSVIFAGLVAWVKENLPAISSIARQVFGAVGNVIKVLAPILIEIAKVLLPAIGLAASLAFKVLDVAFKGIGGAVEILGNIFETVFGFIEGIVKGVIGVIKGIYNAFVGFWNSIQISVPSVDIPFVGKVGGFSIGLPDLPRLAEGGIVTSPTLALIGEKGPEAVVPLGKGGFDTQTIIEVNVLGDLRAEDEQSVADAIGRVLWVTNMNDGALTRPF